MIFFSKSLSALFAVAAVSLLVFPAAATSSSQLCPAGTYSLSGKGPSCLNCPRGTYSDSEPSPYTRPPRSLLTFCYRPWIDQVPVR